MCGCVQAVQAWGIGMDVESSARLAQSLDRAEIPEDPYFNRIVRIMATRCMTQAKYFSSGTVAPAGFRHYGLAAPIYTHFTSPIRRCDSRYTKPVPPIAPHLRSV